MAASKPTASAHRDKAGRPVIAITGMGVVTSLGIGKTDNWAKLSAGKSGIRRISRFPLDSLRTTIAGTVDDVYKGYMPPAELSERIALSAGEEAIAQSGIGSKGYFPGPLFLALPPLEIEWPYRILMAEEAVPSGDAGYPDLMRVARKQQFAPIYETLKYGIIGEHLADHFGTEGSPISLTTACASGATAIQLGVEAIRRGECQAALAVGADGSLTPETIRRIRRRSRFPRIATVLFLLKARQRWSSKITTTPSRAAPRYSAFSKAAARNLTPSTAHVPARTASRSLPACVTPLLTLELARKMSTTSMRTVPRRPRTTRWSIWASPPSSASTSATFRSLQTSR
jgi:hypothetical protein